VNIYSVSKGNDCLTEIEKFESVKKCNLRELLYILKAFESNNVEFSDEIIAECIRQLHKHNMFYL